MEYNPQEGLFLDYMRRLHDRIDRENDNRQGWADNEWNELPEAWKDELEELQFQESDLYSEYLHDMAVGFMAHHLYNYPRHKRK